MAYDVLKARAAMAEHMAHVMPPDASPLIRIGFRMHVAWNLAAEAYGICDKCLLANVREATGEAIEPDETPEVLRQRSRDLAHATLDELIDHKAREMKIATHKCQNRRQG